MILTVEVINNGAFSLLSDMEGLDLIRINTPAKNTVVERKKLSEQFAGALRLSDTEYEVYQNALREGRNEWSYVNTVELSCRTPSLPQPH